MSSPHHLEDEIAWRRMFASQANNRAWALTEQLTRTPEEDQEMLDAAHASMHLWRPIGNDKNYRLGCLLLGQVHALLGNASYAIDYASSAFDYFEVQICEPWEMALAHAVLANAAHCADDELRHALHYRAAQALIDALPDPEEKDILLATLRVVPALSAA
ncbi:hypothetical protein [Rhodoferax sp.]|uniref:hypothetical protein n=1 Tax=Rhodoferax sp. TaxID=50421 RepID=UPI00261F9B0A|nr:hypothetical protein [Rhodoferax sp.]MDD2918306.1 hypothetical protein [Rhodoferax sp.]